MLKAIWGAAIAHFEGVFNSGPGLSSYNPFYMKYSPSETGHFDGQRGYGYVSIEKFIDACAEINAGAKVRFRVEHSSRVLLFD